MLIWNRTAGIYLATHLGLFEQQGQYVMLDDLITGEYLRNRGSTGMFLVCSGQKVFEGGEKWSNVDKVIRGQGSLVHVGTVQAGPGGPNQQTNYWGLNDWQR